MAIINRTQYENQKRKDFNDFQNMFQGMGYSKKQLKELYKREGY